MTRKRNTTFIAGRNISRESAPRFLEDLRKGKKSATFSFNTKREANIFKKGIKFAGGNVQSQNDKKVKFTGISDRRADAISRFVVFRTDETEKFLKSKR